MGRIKNSKEYAIILKTKFGDYYYNYTNHNVIYNEFIFTQDLSKVSKWKTLKIVKNQIWNIKEKLETNYNKILLHVDDVNNFEIDDKNKIIWKRKKPYYPILKVSSNIHLNKAKSNIESLNKNLYNDAEYVFNMIKENKHMEKDFISIFKKLSNDIILYRKEFSFIQKYSNENVETYLDIVNASYGFRFLKLKNLNEIEMKNEIIN